MFASVLHQVIAFNSKRDIDCEQAHSSNLVTVNNLAGLAHSVMPASVHMAKWVIMQVQNKLSSKHDQLVSPVEERHIDFILEEEFSVDPDFLEFFLEQARLSASDKCRIAECTKDRECMAVRSATTAKGETDILVKYGTNKGTLPTAILIEDKIKAGFQPDQAKRYRDRGEEGKGQEWSEYWTCLVSHTKYSSENSDFDAVVSLEALFGYFSQKTDPRSRFRARVLEQTIRKYEATGIQRIDPGMTGFRAIYAAESARVLKPGRWVYDKARDAWWDDTWFFFRGTTWPKAVQIRHQARTGCVDLILPTSDQALLRAVVEQWVASYPDGPVPRIEVISVGRNKSAFQIRVPKVVDFYCDAQMTEFEEFFSAIEFLAGLYERSSNLLPEALRVPDVDKGLLAEENQDLRALRSMLLGFLRSAVICLGTQMPYPLPDLRLLTALTPEKERYFASPGLMGGFLLELREDEEHGRYILSEHWSRQWGSFLVRHKITTSEVLKLSEEA
jgi:hypothetical protein